MEIAKHTVPSVTYSLKIDQELIEETTKDNPLVFLMGAGGMIPGFERQLEGMEAGQVDLEAIVTIPKDIFTGKRKISESLVVGKTIPMQDHEGHPMNGMVLEIGEDTVKMDFNHHLAGKTLNFSGEITDVRAAT